MLFHGCATQTSGDLKTQNISACQESIKVKSKGRVHMGPEAHVYSSKSTNGGKGLKNSKINSYFTP